MANEHSHEGKGDDGRSFSAVFFALGLAETPPNEGLAGGVLIRLLGDLGQSEAAARSAILRMRHRGLLSSNRTGRTVTYAPSRTVIAGQQRHRNQFVGTGPDWDGAFHALLVTVPEHDRPFRDELRRTATMAGYRTLRSGLLIAPSDRTVELGTTLAHTPPAASIVAARLELSPEDTRRVAAELWRLDELATRYRALARTARAVSQEARHHRPRRAAAVQAMAAATLPIFEAIAEDPGLPADLLPEAWPGPDLSAALGEALRVFGPAVATYIHELQDRPSEL